MPSAVAATVTFLKTVGLAVGGLTISAGQALALGAATVVAGAVAAQKLIAELYKIPNIDSDRSRQATVRGTVEPQKLIYGEALVSGPISFVGVAGTDNRDLYHTIVLAGHPSDSISDIYFDDERIQSAHINASGNVTTGTFGPKDGTTICVIRKLTGSQTTADSVLDGAFSTINSSEHIGTNLTYIVTKFTLTDKSQETWDKFMPNDIKALVKGKKVYDPRQDSTSSYYDATVGVSTQRSSDSTTWAWSENPVWCLVDYLTDDRFGMGIGLDRIDLSKAVDAADICDATVSVPGGSEKRFTCNGVIFGTTTHKTNINKLLSSMNGMLTYTNGKYVIRAGAFEAVGAGMTLTEDHMIGPVKLKTSFERNERFNTITGTFIDPSKNYKEIEFPKVQIASALTRDNNEELTQELKLSMTNSRYMAQRLAHKLIQLSDLQKVLTFPTNLAGVNISVGDRVNVTLSEFGYTNKTFVCLGWTLSESGTGGVNLTLREDDSSSYADLAQSGYSTVTPAGGIQQGFFGVPDPSGLTATAHVESIELDWTNPANMTGIIAIEVFASPNSSWSSAVKIGETLGTQFIHDESNGVDSIVEGDQRYYWVRARRFPSGEGSDAVSDRNPDSDTSTVQATKGALGALASQDTVGDGQIDDNAVGNDQIADGAVDTDQIADDAVDITKIANTLQSTNYSQGSAGWKLTTDGTFEAGDGTFRGAVTATSITLDGTSITEGQLESSVQTSLGLADTATQNDTAFAAKIAWGFDEDSQGFVAVQHITLTHNTDGYIVVTSTGNDPILRTPTIAVDGGKDHIVRVRIKRTSGSGWQGTLYYQTSGHTESESYRKTISDTTVTDEWVVLEYDMSNLTAGGTDWVDNTITNMRFDWGNSSSDTFQVDWIAVGTKGAAPVREGGDVISGTIGGTTITGTQLYQGAGNWANTDTGFYLDSTGKFSLKDNLFYNPTNSRLTVAGNITADTITVEDSLEVFGPLKAKSLAAGSITREMLSQDVLDEIFGALATSVGGSNGDYKEGTGNFTTSGGTVTLGTSSDKFDHGTADVDVEFIVDHFFYSTTNYTTAQAQATLNFEVSADGTFTDLTSATKTHTLQFLEYDLSSYYGYTYLVYYLTGDVTKTFTSGSGNDIPDDTDLQFRVRVTGVGTAFTSQTVPFTLEANEGVTGVVSTGGNADTLDNLDSTAFLRSNTNDTFDGDLTITGQLILQGSIDQYNVTDLDVTDKTITVNSGNTQSLSDGAGLIVDRGTAADASITWDETNDRFTLNNPLKQSTTTTATSYDSVGEGVYGSNSTLAGPYGNHHILQVLENPASGGRVAQVVYNDTEAGGMWFRLKQGTSIGWHDWSRVWSSYDFSSTKISNWDSAYTYSQVGHVPLSGGTMTGALTTTGLTVNGDSISFNTSAGDLDIQALGGSSNQIEGSGSIKIKAAGGAVDLINGTTEVLSTISDGVTIQKRINNSLGNLIDHDGSNNYIKGGNGGSNTLYVEAATLVTDNGIIVGNTTSKELRTRHLDGKSATGTSRENLYLNYYAGNAVIVGRSDQNATLQVHGPIQVGTTTVISAARNISSVTLNTQDIGTDGTGFTGMGFGYSSNTLTRAVGSGVQWYKVAAFVGGVKAITMRVSAGGDNTNATDTFFISCSSYGMKANIMKFPSTRYNGSKLMEVRTKFVSGANYEIWIKLNSITTSTGTLHVSMNDSGCISSLSAGTEPTYNSSYDATLPVSVANRSDFAIQTTSKIEADEGFAVNNNVFIDSNRNITAGNITSSGTITATKLIDADNVNAYVDPNGASVLQGSLLSKGHSSGDNWMPYTDGNFYIRAPLTTFDNDVRIVDLLTLGTNNSTTNAGRLRVEGAFANTSAASHPRITFNDDNFGIGAGGWATTGNNDDLYIWAYNGAGRKIRFATTSAGSQDVTSASWLTNATIDNDGNFDLARGAFTSSGSITSNDDIVTTDGTGTNKVTLSRYTGVTFRGNGTGSRSLGTTSNDALNLIQNNQTRVIVDTTGNVVFNRAGNTNRGNIAIGPQTSGAAKWSSISGAHYNQTTGSGNGSGAAGIFLIGSHAANSYNDVYIGGGPYEMNPATNIRFHTHTATTHSTGGSLRMFINPNGQVGVNTTNFATTGAKLQVKGTSSAGGVSGSNFAGSIFSVEGSSTVYISMGTTGASSYYGWIEAHDAGTGTNYDLNLNQYGGDVGIGMSGSNPQARLHVMNVGTEQSRFAYDVNNYTAVNYNGFNTVGGNMLFQISGTEKLRLTSDALQLRSGGSGKLVYADITGNEGRLTLSNGSNWGLIMRGITNAPRIGAWTGGTIAFWAANDSQLNSVDTTKGVSGEMFTIDNGNNQITSHTNFVAIGAISARDDYVISTQGGAQLVLYDNTTSALNMRFGVDTDIGSAGGGSIQVTQSGVSNDRELKLNPFGGKVGVNVSQGTGLDFNFQVAGSSYAYSTYFSGANSATYTLDVNSTQNYASRITHARQNNATTFADAIFLQNTNSASSGNYVSIGLSTNGSDGQHHRAQLRARVDTSVTYGGIFEINTRGSGGSNNVGIRVDANSDISLPNGRIGVGKSVGTNDPALDVQGVNTTDGTASFRPNSSKGSRVSHLHYGANGDWYIRSASNSGQVYIQDGGGNIRLTTGSSGNVGIGTANPSVKLQISGGGVGSSANDDLEHTIIQGSRHKLVFKEIRTAAATDWNSTTFRLQHRVDNTNMSAIDFVSDSGYGRHIDFLVSSNTFAARINSTGDFLVGKTSSNYTVAGGEMRDHGTIGATTTTQAPFFANRTTDDGNMFEFYRSTTHVGNIGTVDSDLTIYSTASGHGGLRFGNGYVGPTNNAGTVVDNTIDLGLPTVKWRDLWLSRKLDLLYVDSSGGSGWDTRIHIGKTDDLPNGTGFPTYTATGGFGIQMQANSDGCFYGIEQYSSGHYRPLINWGDDTGDSPFRIAFNNSTRFQMDTSGNFTANGNVTAYSDARLKENVETIPDALGKVRQIRGVTFTRNDQKDTKKRHMGVIAQELEAAGLSEVVQYDEEHDVKTVAYGNLVGLCLQALKEADEKINSLTKRIEELENGNHED